METKKEILEKINSPTERKGLNSMGVCESWYNPYFMLRNFFKDKDINPEELTEKELNNLLELADYAGEAFY